jgi:hypothetical protein
MLATVIIPELVTDRLRLVAPSAEHAGRHSFPDGRHPTIADLPRNQFLGP